MPVSALVVVNQSRWRCDHYGVDAVATRARSGRAFVASGIGLLALAVGELGIGMALWHAPPPLWVLSGLAGGLLFGAAGFIAWWARPDSRSGPWMVVFAVLQILRQVEVPATSAAAGPAALLRVAVIFLQPAVGGQLLLSFPSGRLPGRAERRLVRAGFLVAVTGTAVVIPIRQPVPWVCAVNCAPNPFGLVIDLRLYLAVQAAIRLTLVGLAVVALVLLVRQARRWTPRQRRTRGFMLVTSCLAVVGYATSELLIVSAYPHWIPVAAATPLEHVALWAIALALPVAFLVGILNEQLAFGVLAELLPRLESAPPEDLEKVLATALRDPGLRLAFSTPTGLVDVTGCAVVPPQGCGTTALGDPVVAVVLHDPAVAEHRPLLAAVASAARLVLENSRLQAEVRAQLAEVRASRQRIVTAADDARRRVERDLHDGAQQRLLGAGLALQVLEQQIDRSGPAAALLGEVRQELLTAVRELRELAAGIYPAVLTDQGLYPALQALAARCPIHVALDGADPGPLPAATAAAGYFCASEAVTNAVKHARASAVHIRVRREHDRLLISVSDDGVGGARADGHGLRGLADRAAALDGRLTVGSPSGGGTRVDVELPCV